MNALKKLYQRFFTKKTDFQVFLYQILGFYPENLSFYRLAFQHKSKHKENNERLEFLGDAVIDSIFSEILYHKFPHKNEGQLSQLRAKIVSRKHLNYLGKQLKLECFLQYELKNTSIENTNLLGNTFESLLGAMYLDLGYAKTKKVVQNKIEPFFNWKDIEYTTIDFKSKLFQYAQKHHHSLSFNLIQSNENGEPKYFETQVILNEKPLAKGSGRNKKQAEQNAARASLSTLHN